MAEASAQPGRERRLRRAGRPRAEYPGSHGDAARDGTAADMAQGGAGFLPGVAVVPRCGRRAAV